MAGVRISKSEDHTLRLNDHNALKNAVPRALFIPDLQVFAETFSRGSKTLSFHHTLFTLFTIMNMRCRLVQIHRAKVDEKFGTMFFVTYIHIVDNVLFGTDLHPTCLKQSIYWLRSKPNPLSF